MPRFVVFVVGFLLVQVAVAQAVVLPSPESIKFCQVVQTYMANTDKAGNNTMFTDMPEYRHSKPKVDPHQIYQVVSYAGQIPIMVSCKIKGAAHIRAAYGEAAAGEQLYCPDVTRLVQAQAVAELSAEGLVDAAAKAQAFVVENSEPFMTGRDYLADFELSFVGDDGAIHINSPGLFHDYDGWTTWILPESFEGQAYCHLATVPYLKALASGAMEPGTVMTTADDAAVTPQ